MRVEIDSRHFSHLESEILLMPEDRPDRIGDLGRDQAGDGNLVEQRLEKVIVLPVNQCNTDRGFRQLLSGFQASKACANDHYMGEFLCVHIYLSGKSKVNINM